MLVWEKIANNTNLDHYKTAEWLSKYGIKACELENKIKYTGRQVDCIKDCKKCLDRYLDINLNSFPYVEVTDEMGEKQLRLW